jgi:hypothetical protein
MNPKGEGHTEIVAGPGTPQGTPEAVGEVTEGNSEGGGGATNVT